MATEATTEAETVEVEALAEEKPEEKAGPPAYVPRFVKTSMPPSPEGWEGQSLYVISDAKDLPFIDELEGPVYYVLAAGEVRITQTTGNSTSTVKKVQPGLYKRVRTFSGNALVPVKRNEDAELGQVEEKIYFDLPPMPEEFIERIDYFFRAVYKKNKTEAIVLLAFDRDYADAENESDGWTVLVPDQTNTGGNCDYKPESVMEDKPENVTIVGTWHSHPNMSAFASHTDEKDQFNNDGLHITTGWKGNGPSEFYIEYQLSNTRFILDEDEVFDLAPKGEHDVDEWLDKVEKKTYGNPSQAGGHTSGATRSSTSTTPSTGSATVDSDSRLHGEFFRQRHNANRPKGPGGCPDLVQNIVIAVVGEKTERCPVCQKKFDSFSTRNRRCTDCFTYLSLAEDEGDLTKIYEARKQAYQGKAYMPGLEFISNENMRGSFNVLLWDPTKTGTNTNKTTHIYGPQTGLSTLGKKALRLAD